MQKVFFILSFLFFYASVNAQQFNTIVSKQVVIVASTKSYAEATKIAIAASKKLKKKLILRGLKENKKIGLTLSKNECELYDYPCYIARGEGNAENSNYVSIEFSDAYEGFEKGYYIVVTALAEPNSASIKTELINAKKFFNDAYAKKTKVWFGCMH